MKQKVEITMSASLMGWAYKMIPNFISTMTYYAENHIHWLCLIILHLFIVIGPMIGDWPTLIIADRFSPPLNFACLIVTFHCKGKNWYFSRINPIPVYTIGSNKQARCSKHSFIKEKQHKLFSNNMVLYW